MSDPEINPKRVEVFAATAQEEGTEDDDDHDDHNAQAGNGVYFKRHGRRRRVEDVAEEPAARPLKRIHRIGSPDIGDDIVEEGAHSEGEVSGYVPPLGPVLNPPDAIKEAIGIISSITHVVSTLSWMSLILFMFSAAGSRAKAALKAGALAKGQQAHGAEPQRSIDSWAISPGRTPSPHPVGEAHESLPEGSSTGSDLIFWIL
jgi:hypothetical protein